MSKKTNLKPSEITVLNRQRIDLGELDSLCTSMDRYGLIQPIVINQEKQLIAGGRRLAAALRLGWKTVPCVYHDTMSQADLHILELEENIRRKDETWQERCLHIATIHNLKTQESAEEGFKWAQQATAELIGVDSVREINHALKMSRLLKEELDENNQPKENARFWKCENFSQAFVLSCKDEEQLLLAELSRRQNEAVVDSTTIEQDVEEVRRFEALSQDDEALSKAREEYYSNPHNPPGSFEEYWKEKQDKINSIKNTVYISSMLVHGDSIKYMHDNAGRFDHVITDIPYGIDMDMLNQQNQHGGFNNIDTVKDAHKVEYNLVLIEQFFKAAWVCTKQNSFVITWADQMNWQFMYDCALAAGFAVQRWPIIWHKSQAMNQCVAYNTTKDTEIAIVCRKPGATLATQPNTSVIRCGKDDLCSEINHPFAKPFECWQFLIKLVSLEGELILEPFAGGGSGVISLLRMNRKVIGVELEQHHYNELVENVKRLHYLPQNPHCVFK